MILKRRVALNDVQLDSLDDRIIITGIDEAAGKDNITAVSGVSRNGQRVTARRRDSLDVTVKFALNIKNTGNRMRTREQLLEQINAWAANGGILTLDKRNGRRLKVLLAQAPGPGDMFNWTNEYTMVFRAYGCPYWQDDKATSATGAKEKSGDFYIVVPGNTETVAAVTVANKSGATINNVAIKIAGKEIKFAGLKMTGSQKLVIDHVNEAGLFYFRAMIGNKSVLANRTGEDDFYVMPGKTKIIFSADRAVQVTVSVRGRYL